MVRTQIQLTEQQAAMLRRLAAQRGVSMAELIRQSIDGLLRKTGERAPEELRQRAAKVTGRFRSGTRDGAVRHDDYLSEAFGR